MRTTRSQWVMLACSGWATAPYFDFLYGVNNQLAQTHLPGAAPYDDTFLGPKGRLADMARNWLVLECHASCPLPGSRGVTPCAALHACMHACCA